MMEPPLSHHRGMSTLFGRSSPSALLARLGWFVYSFLRLLCFSSLKWAFRACSMVLFVTCLMPAWYSGLSYYLSSSNVIRDIRYGSQRRNFLDICLPRTKLTKRPVVVFVTGGIWLIGYKAWGMFVGKILTSFGIVVVLPDYRNFPQGSLPDMLDDVDRALSWVTRNIEDYGGDRDAIFLMGQSAGAHLGMMALLRRAKREPKEHPSSDSWEPSRIRAYIGVAGPYNVHDLREGFARRGMSKTLLDAIMGGQEHLKRFSADYVVSHEPEFREGKGRLPPMILLHGTADLVVPFEASLSTARRLAAAGIQTFVKFYEGKSHTDSIIEDLVYTEGAPIEEMEEDDMMMDIAAIVLSRDRAAETARTLAREVSPDDLEQGEEEEQLPSSPSKLLRELQGESPLDFNLKEIRKRVMPRFLWKGARFFNPF